MALQRKEYWDTRHLHDFLMQRAEAPFAWGVNDCCLFAADAVMAMTGVDPAAEFRGKYSDGPSALRAIGDVCAGRSVADAVAHCMQRVRAPELANPLFARRGDLVLVEDDLIPASGLGNLIAGIVHLSGRHVAVVGENGLKRVSIRAARRAWRI